MGKRPLTHPTCLGNQTGPSGTKLAATSPRGDGKPALGLDPPVVARTLSRALFPEPRLDAPEQVPLGQSVPLP